MKKNIALIYILGISILFAPVAIAAFKGKENKKNEKKTTQQQKSKKNVKITTQKEKSKKTNTKPEKNKKLSDSKMQLAQEDKEWEKKKKEYETYSTERSSVRKSSTKNQEWRDEVGCRRNTKKA